MSRDLDNRSVILTELKKLQKIDENMAKVSHNTYHRNVRPCGVLEFVTSSCYNIIPSKTNPIFIDLKKRSST
jgi:hypothetical protein